MHIVKVGINYQIAPLAIREKISFSDNETVTAMQVLIKENLIHENVIISTCNRTEIFAVVEDIKGGIVTIQQFLLDWFNLSENQLVPYVQYRVNDEAVVHLFRLMIGLDSMVIGETQILGQVRDTFLTAQEGQTTGEVFNELFKRAITFAKRAHRDTSISERSVSISYVAVELAKQIFGCIENKHVVILGAGEMGELTLKNLKASGVENITVVNRTLERAKKLAHPFHAKAVHMGQLLYVLKDTDILISSTSSDEVVFTKDSLQAIRGNEQNKPLIIIDIAVPRDIDPSVNTLNNVHLYDIDDLQGVVDKNLAARKKVARQIEKKLEYELSSFNNWMAMRDAVPAIKALREKALSIQENTLNSIYNKLPDLTEREMNVLEKHTKSIIHQILEAPIKRAREMGENKEGQEKIELFQGIFGLNLEETEPKGD